MRKVLDGLFFFIMIGLAVLIAAVVSHYAFGAAGLDRKLSVSGSKRVLVSVSPADLDGKRTGNAPISFRYNRGTTVTATCQDLFGGKKFIGWTSRGAVFSNSRTLRLTIDSDFEMIPLYDGDLAPVPKPTPVPTPTPTPAPALVSTTRIGNVLMEPITMAFFELNAADSKLGSKSTVYVGSFSGDLTAYPLDDPKKQPVKIQVRIQMSATWLEKSNDLPFKLEIVRTGPTR